MFNGLGDPYVIREGCWGSMGLITWVPRSEQTDRQILLKTLPFRKLRIRAVITGTLAYSLFQETRSESLTR